MARVLCVLNMGATFYHNSWWQTFFVSAQRATIRHLQSPALLRKTQSCLDSPIQNPLCYDARKNIYQLGGSVEMYETFSGGEAEGNRRIGNENKRTLCN